VADRIGTERAIRAKLIEASAEELKVTAHLMVVRPELRTSAPPCETSANNRNNNGMGVGPEESALLQR
jgi:hypothetical protein